MKMDLMEIRRGDLNWINLAQDGDMADSCVTQCTCWFIKCRELTS